MKTESVDISAGTSCYRAVIGRDLLANAGELMREVVHARRCAVIADHNSANLFGDKLIRALRVAESDASMFTIAPGEQSKTLETVGRICEEMSAAGFDRSALVIGVGGGVVGDVSGFVAAIFNRGIPHVQIPTTLLAMVDSSVGGKTGVNTRAGKNLLGAIHQPQLIIADTSTLDSLPEREMRQGFAEIVKHAIIRDSKMFEMLRGLSFRPERSEVEKPCGITGGVAHTATGSLDFARDDLQMLIKRNVEIKAAIVAEDERETTGTRALLNFGHTIGHAIERAGNYELLRHGEAISIGIGAACDVSVKRAGLAESERDEVVALLATFGLPTKLPDSISREQIFDAVRFDKKFEAGAVRFVVAPRIGDAHLSSDVTLADIRGAIDRL